MTFARQGPLWLMAAIALAVLMLSAGGRAGDDEWLAFPSDQAAVWGCQVLTNGISSKLYVFALRPPTDAERDKGTAGGGMPVIYDKWQAQRPGLKALDDCRSWLVEAGRRVALAQGKR